MTKNIEVVISGLNKKVLENRVFELDSVLGGVMLNSMTYENINIELGRIAEKVDNTDQSNMAMMALTLRDIAHSIGLLSDLMNTQQLRSVNSVGNASCSIIEMVCKPSPPFLVEFKPSFCYNECIVYFFYDALIQLPLKSGFFCFI